VREQWPALLGDELGTVIGTLDLALGVLQEEERGLHLRFGGGGAGGAGEPDARSRRTSPSMTTLQRNRRRSRATRPGCRASCSWAKSTYVWLDQLSRSYGRDIRTLDAIPDDELDTLARWGVSALWLIGLWERSNASERIKRMRGNSDAAASAYSLHDYRIADDLGGERAYADLRERAWARGIRLSSDMVPEPHGP
jgi:hypothetical protein